MSKCLLCNKEAIKQVSMVVDIEYDSTDPLDGLNSVTSEIGLCEEHLLEYEEREGNFDPNKYR